MTKRVVSISLGSSRRNKAEDVELFGQTFRLERIGTDGDPKKFAQMFAELDGQVAAFGIGGADRYVVSGTQRYEFREVRNWVRGAVKTPVLDGSRLKHTLEREAVEVLGREGMVDFSKERALLMSAVDRFGMAQALAERCPNIVFGDLIFGLGLPIRVRKYSTVKLIAALSLPVITQLPFQWFYPTGAKQEKRDLRFARFFSDRTLICGDSLYILRYAPDDLTGRTILTQSMRAENFEFLRSAGAKRVITTTPMVNGETFATNVMEAAIVAALEVPPDQLTDDDFRQALKTLGWKPTVTEF